MSGEDLNVVSPEVESRMAKEFVQENKRTQPFCKQTYPAGRACGFRISLAATFWDVPNTRTFRTHLNHSMALSLWDPGCRRGGQSGQSRANPEDRLNR